MTKSIFAAPLVLIDIVVLARYLFGAERLEPQPLSTVFKKQLLQNKSK